MKVFALIAAIIVTLCSAWAGEPPVGSEAVVKKLLTATEAGDYEAFVADGDAAFKALKPEQFMSAVIALAPKLKAGFELSYLGDLKQKGFGVTLWRLRFPEGDDALATLSLKDNKVGGFWIK